MDLKAELEKLKMTKAQFARHLKVDNGLVSKWCLKTRKIPRYAIAVLKCLQEGKDFDIDVLKYKDDEISIVKRISLTYSISYEEMAEKIGVAVVTIRNWAKKNPKFSKQALCSLEFLQKELISKKQKISVGSTVTLKGHTKVMIVVDFDIDYVTCCWLDETDNYIEKKLKREAIITKEIKDEKN